MASGTYVARKTLDTIKHKINDYKDDAVFAHYGMTNRGDYCCYYCNGLIIDMNYEWIQVGRAEEEYLVCGQHCEALPDELKVNCTTCGDIARIGDYGHYAMTMTWKCKGCMFKK